MAPVISADTLNHGFLLYSVLVLHRAVEARSTAEPPPCAERRLQSPACGPSASVVLVCVPPGGQVAVLQHAAWPTGLADLHACARHDAPGHARRSSQTARCG